MDRADATGLGIAAVGHIALLTALVMLVDPTPKGLPRAPTIEVSFEEDVAAISAGETTTPAAASVAPDLGTPEDAAPAPEPVPEPAPTPTPAPPQPQPTPRPTPAPPQPRAQPQPQPVPQPRQPAQRRPAPAQQPARPAPRSQPKATPPSGRSGVAPAPRGARIGADILKGIGNDPASPSQKSAGAVVSNAAKASMDAAILRALLPCQRQSLPAPEARSIRVRVEVTLNPNGSLASARVMSVVNDDPDLRIYEQRMRDLATNVVEQCAPIRGLPAEYYNVPRGWRTFRYVFPNS